MSDFEHDDSFESGELSGHLQLDRYEAAYQQLFSEALEDGVITHTERERLEAAATELGLDGGRLSALEDALRRSYEAHHGFSVLDTSRMFSPRDTLAAPAPDFVQTVQPPPLPLVAEESEEVSALQARVAFLEERVRELESQLEEARQQVAYEVDFSDLDAPVPSVVLDEPEALHRRLRHDPRDVTILKSLFAAYQHDLDRQWCVAHVLVYLDAADEPQRKLCAAHEPAGLIQPSAALTTTDFRRLLHHPDDEVLTSDILGVIVSAVLLAHSAALRKSGQLPELDPSKRLDPTTSTVQAARCFGWAAQILGMSPPQLYATPDVDALAVMVPTLPPTCSLGKRCLSGRSAEELAFVAGQQLAYYRPERFIRLLVPSIVDLQDLFLAALAIGNPALPLNAAVRGRVEPIAAAIEPLLESTEIDRLRGAYKRFVGHGGIANLQRWGTAADLTAARAGFALCGRLGTAERMLKEQPASQIQPVVDDLIVFATSERYAKLRKLMGLAIGDETT